MKTGIFTKKVRAILIAAVAVAILIAVLSSAKDSHTTNFVQTLLAPFRSLSSALTRSAERYYNYAFNYEELEAENAVLRQKIMEMEEDVRESETLSRENERLKALLNVAEEHSDYTFVPAYIISWDSGNWTSTFTISRGIEDGIKPGMCAVTEFGEVVGIVEETGSNWSLVTSILDSSLEVSASVVSTGYTGVVEGSYRSGEEGNLRLNYLPNNSVMKNGDQVVTTGSEYYPKDLVIGYVVDAGMDDNGVSKYALLESNVDFNSLEQVYLIANYERHTISEMMEEEASGENGGESGSEKGNESTPAEEDPDYDSDSKRS